MGSHMLWRRRYLEQTSLDPRWGSLQHCHHAPPDLSNLCSDAPPPSCSTPLQQALPLADWKQRYKKMTMRAHNLTENWKNGRYKQRAKATGSYGIYCLQFNEEKIFAGSHDRGLKSWGLRDLDMQNEFVRAAGLCARLVPRAPLCGHIHCAVPVGSSPRLGRTPDHTSVRRSTRGTAAAT